MIKIISEYSPQYDLAALHPLQSWAWGEARKQMGIEVVRIGEFDRNKLVNVFQLTIHPLPISGYKIGYLPRSVFPSTAVLQFLYQLGKKNKIIFFKIEPYILKSQFQTSSQQSNNNILVTNYKLIKSKHPLFPEWTIILDLNKSEDELLKSMHYKTRYNIRLARKKGVTVKEISDDQGFRTFLNLFFATCHRQHYFGHTETYHRIIWNNLRSSIAHILIAFYKTTPLAAFEIFFFKDTGYYPYGGTSVQHRNLMASNLLMWEAIRLVKKLGAKKFDFWGSLSPNYNDNHPWAGFTRFKQGYGGEFIQFVGSYDLIINPLLYEIYSISHSLRRLLLTLKTHFS